MRRVGALGEVSAALADVQARQQSLARGSVLSRASSPPPASYDAPSPPPISKEKAQRTATPFQWLKRRVVRRNDRKESGALEDLGCLDLVASASLASVRVLIGQFIALPPRCDFAFVHPTTNARVDATEENDICARDIPFVCIVLLQVKEAGVTRGDALPLATAVHSAAAARAEVEVQQHHLRPETGHVQRQALKQKRPRTVGVAGKRQVATAVAALEPATPALSSDSRPVSAVSSVKREIVVSPDALKLGSERQVALLPAKEAKRHTGEEVKTEGLPLDTPTKLGVSTAEDQLDTDNKGASIASLSAGPRLEPSQAKITDQDTTTEKLVSAPRKGRTSGNDAVPREHKQIGEEAALPANMKTVTTAHEQLLDIIGRAGASLNIKDQSHEFSFIQQPVSSDTSTANPTPEVPSSPEKSITQSPGHLRRSRRFRALRTAESTEKSWNSEELEQQEVVTNAEIEELLRSLLEIIRTGLEGVGTHQLDAALLYYGIDYHVLELHELLLALDTELDMRCIHVRGGVDGQLKQYLLKIFPVDKANGLDPEALQHFEFALNVFAGMRGWQSFTKIRADCFEDQRPQQLIPGSDSRRLALLRLSGKDHQLFALASSDNPAVRLESWLADGMEITYVLLYGFLQSRRNSSPKPIAKLEVFHLREERIQAAIQKLSSFGFEVWKRLDFRSADIEDTSLLRRVNELIKAFLRESNHYSRELEGSVFFPALVGYLNRKSKHLAQSLSEHLSTSADCGKPQATVLACLRLLHQNLVQPGPYSASAEAYMQSIGLKIIDVDKINASRSSAALGRLYVNGRESILTHHQCNLMASDTKFSLKPRWGQQELSKGEISSYCFIGPKEVAVEYVFVRTKLLASTSANLPLEDRETIGRKEAQQAFALLCGDSLVVPSNAAIGVGINIIHTDLLPHISSLFSLGTALREYPGVTSISFGYSYTPAGQANRVIFRVHTDKSLGKHDYVNGPAGCWGLWSAVKGIDRFLMSAQEEETIALCETDGLRFLNSFLQERGYHWTTAKYGKPFFDFMYGNEDEGEICPRGILLSAMKQTIAVIPSVPHHITKTNTKIIAQMIEKYSYFSQVSDEASGALLAICSNSQQQKLTGISSEYFAPRMTEKQKLFATGGGLDILVTTITALQGVSAYKESMETAIVSLLMTEEISATKAGLLAHWQEWLEFYVENRAWTRRPAGPTFSVFLLRQVHTHFFASTTFLLPELQKCPCGCARLLMDVLDASISVMKVFVKLMLTDICVVWAQEEMQGPRDCVAYLLWSAHPGRWVPAMAELHELIISSLCEFLERLTSSHQYLCLLSALSPPLLDLLHQHDCISLHTGVLRVLSLAFRLAVDKKVWTISMETFLESFYRILESVCDDPSLSTMNTAMINVLFNVEHRKKTANCSDILGLLHEEHVNFVGGSGQLSPIALSRTKPLLQTLVSLCSLTWYSVLQPACQIPALISLGWLLTNLKIADDLAKLELDEVLLTLMENESAVVSILAARAYIVFLFQGLLSKVSIDEYQLKRLCNLLTTVLACGPRPMLSPKRLNYTEDSDDIQFAANQPDTYGILHRYQNLNRERLNHVQQKELNQEKSTVSDPPPFDVIWESNEWNDPSRTMTEKLANHLKLLVVLSSMTKNIVSIGNSDELKEIILLLVRFIRERIHSASLNITLYLLPLRNIIWAARSDIMKWGVSDLTEPSFLRKLLLLAKDKLYQDLASGILWGLADAFEKSNIYLLSFEVDGALATSSKFTKRIGFSVMVDNLASKLSASRSIENDAGAMASMIANPASSSFFLANYGYPFILKLMESILRLIRAGYSHESVATEVEDKSAETKAGETFGSTLFYMYPIWNRQERELFQLCRAAANVLEAMQRISPESVLDEAARTKTTIVPLLAYPNRQVAQYAVLCCSIHLQTHPTQCGKLLENDFQDRVIAFFFDDEFPPIQIAAFSCMKLALADQKNLATLQLKLFPLRHRIVSCLRNPNFEVKRKTILFLVEAVFRLDDQTFRDGIAETFAAAGNNGLLMELFDSVSKEIALNPSAGSVLQLLVRLMIKLDVVVHTDGDQLVHVICHTLKAHSNDTFLRPMLFNFLHQIVTQNNHVEYLERKSRLDILTELLSRQLTLNELRNMADMLLLVSTKHGGIRHYLSGFESDCITKIASVINGFSEYSQYDDVSKTSAIQQDEKPIQDSSHEGLASGNQLTEILEETAAKHLLKVTTNQTVYISHFTEDIYELFLRLLLLLVTGPEFNGEERYGCICESIGCSNCDPCDIIAKTNCGQSILRLSTAHRVLCPTYDLHFLLSAKGEPAESILNLSVKVLEILAANSQSRVQMLRGSAKSDWFWVPALLRNAVLPESSVPEIGQSDRETFAGDTIQLLGHLSATKEVAQRLIIERAFISMMFSYLTPTDQRFTSNESIRRASSFTLARLAEFPSIVRDTFFQEKLAMITHALVDNEELQISNQERDMVTLANKIVLARNRTLLTPGLQGRSVDDDLLTLLVHLLVSEDVTSLEVGILAGDVLASLLYFRVNSRNEKRLRSVLWHNHRALSPSKSIASLNHPSSKRLTAYLHHWIRPMLQKVRHSSFGAFHEDSAQVLSDELTYTYKLLAEPSVNELLRVLISLHLPSSGACEEVSSNNNLSCDDVDVIQMYNTEYAKTLRPRSLQYVFNAADRSTREPNDQSFRGSAHTWLFLRKLWELASAELDEGNERNRTILSEIRDIVSARIPHVFLSWKRESVSTRYSLVAFDRRKCFLDFVITIGKWDANILSVIDMKNIMDVVIRNGPDADATMGREYLLLSDMCQQHSPENLEKMIKCFGLDCIDDLRSKPSDAFKKFWSSVHLKLLPVRYSLGGNTKMKVLDPSPEPELVMVFGIKLLQLLSSRIPLAAKWYAVCQGETQLLDMLLLASKVSALQMQNSLVRSFLSNLLCLATQLVELDPAKYHRLFASDPRYLRCVVDLIYAPAHEVQTSAIRLLQTLAQQPRLFAMLSRMENVVHPLGTVGADVVSYAGEMLIKYELSPPLSQDCVALLAHISFVPFFTDLCTTELVKLALGFRLCSQPKQHCWLILMNDCRFSSIPEWMITEQSCTMASFASSMKRIQKQFEGSFGIYHEKTNFSMYSIDKEAYMSHTSASTRRRIAMRLAILLKTYTDDSTIYRGSMRARNGLVTRLGRLLVEDRAEIIRRVAYTKRVSERVISEEMQTRQLSDLLQLLHESTLFEGIERDLLANLAFRLGNPVEFVIDEVAQRQNLPLLLLYNESVEFEMHLHGSHEEFRGTVSRGGLLGFPPWLHLASSPHDLGTFTVVHKCQLLGTIISLEALESELPKPALSLVKDRLCRAYEVGDVQAISYLMGQHTLSVTKSEKRRLISSSSTLIVQLISTDVFVESLLNDNWAVGVIVDVALAAVPADVVLNALTVIAAMTATEAYSNRFCAKIMTLGNDHVDGQAKDRDASLWHSFAGFMNRFKIRLWQNRPEILEKFFLIQSQVASSLPAFWTNLESNWTTTYLRSCLALLQSEQSRVPEVTACHLSCAILHRVDFLFRCGYGLDLHLAIAQLLTRSHSGDIIGILQLFNILSADESLCEQVWDHVVHSADTFDEALKSVAAAVNDYFATGNTSISDLEVYCQFLCIICSSGNNEQLEVTFRYAIQDRFGILLVLLQQLHALPEAKSVHTILRCIGCLCINIPSNCNLAVTFTNTANEKGEFIDTVVKMLAELESHLECHMDLGPLEIEATFSCINAITSVSGQSECFDTNYLVAIALRVIQLLTSRSPALRSDVVAAVESAVKVLLRIVAGQENSYIEVFNEVTISTLVAGYEHISKCYSVANDNHQLLRLLESYTALLDTLLASRRFRDVLWTQYLNDSETSSSFFAWVFHWISFKPDESLAINALNPGRASKRNRVVAVANKMQALILSVAIELTEHHSMVEVLSLHSQFPMIVGHIFTVLHDETHSIDFGRAILWVKFICFISEQWDEATSLQRWQSDRQHLNAVKSFLTYVKVPALLKACAVAQAQENSFICYAIRFLWLLVKVQSVAGKVCNFVDNCDNEWVELVPLATELLKSSSSSARSKCYSMGLLAELEFGCVPLTSDTNGVANIVHAALTMFKKPLSRRTLEIAASNITIDFLSSRKWKNNDAGTLDEDLLTFALTHQSQRFVLYLSRVPDTRAVLFHSDFIHPLMCWTLFQDAIAVLSVKTENELWIRAQEDSLQLIQCLLRAADEADSNSNVTRSSVLRSYRLVARRGQLLKCCMNLLIKPWKLEFRCTILESMMTYINQNVGGGAEVATLREQGQGDLMELLLSIVNASKYSESPNISKLCLQLYNSTIEYSLENAMHAVHHGFSELCWTLREAVSREGTLMRCDALRMMFFVVRMIGNSKLGADRSIGKEIWEMTSTVLLHPLVEVETTKYALEIISCCQFYIREELLVMITREWDERGKQVVLALANLVQGETPLKIDIESECATSIAKLSMKALTELSFSDSLCACISNDPDIVKTLGRVCEYPKSKHQSKLLNILLTSGTANTSLLSEQLLDQLTGILTQNPDCRVYLLGLLPSLIRMLNIWVLENGGGFWNDLLLCILEEMSWSTEETKVDESHLMIATKAWISIWDVCDCRDIPRDILVRSQDTFKRLTDTWKRMRDLNNDTLSISGSQHFHDVSRKSPVSVELLVLSSLTKLSPCIEVNIPVKQYAVVYISLWMNASVCRNCNIGGEHNVLLLSSLALYFLEFTDPSNSLLSVSEFQPYWRLLTRMFATYPGDAVHFKLSELMLLLLRGPTSREYRCFLSNTLKLDLVEVLWWEVSTSTNKTTVEQGELRNLWYSLLNELCYNRDSALAIMEKEFIEQFVVAEGHPQSDELLQHSGKTKFLRLLSSVFHATNSSDHVQFFQKTPATMDVLADLCMDTVALIFDMSEAKWNATEVLYALSMYQQTLSGVWKSCSIYPVEQSDAALVKGRERLRAVSEMLLQCEDSVADLIIVLTLVLKICGSGQYVAILIRARGAAACWSMIDVLVQVLEQCLTDVTCPSALQSSNLRPIMLTTNSPAEFLPYHFSTELHTDATVLALQLVQLCVADHQLTQFSLGTELDLLRNLLTCIATSNWKVASTAAVTLSSLIRCGSDCYEPEDDEAGVTRYMCDQGGYQRLAFFSDIDAQEVVCVLPPTPFPAFFVLLVRWLRFYSVNLTLLSDVHPDARKELVSSLDSTDTDLYDLHERFVASILELLLYIVSNFHSVVYKKQNSGESEESEHSLFLQSLLALCQRHPRKIYESDWNSNEDICLVSSGRIRSRALELVQLLCSLDVLHTSSVKVFTNPQQMQILMMIVERSTSNVEQNAAAQLMESLALKDAVKTLLIRNTSLLFRLGVWLEIKKLQLLAAAIIKRLATSSSTVSLSSTRSVFGFSPNVQQQLAQFLFVGVEPEKLPCEPLKKNPPLLQNVNRIRIQVVHIGKDGKHSPRLSSSSSLLSVQLKFEIVDQIGRCLRQFEYQTTLQSEKEPSHYEFLAEPAADLVRCTMNMCSTTGSEEPTEIEFELSREFRSSTHRSGSVLIRYCNEPVRTDSALSSSSRGVLTQLLRQETDTLSLEFFQALSGIVAEFCKSYKIFCDPVVDLPSQILIVLATSVEFAPDGKMDVTCFENLSSWFSSKLTGSNFKSNIFPVLRLIQGARQLSCVNKFTEQSKQEIIGTSYTDSAQYNFLEKLVELIGSVEIHDLTANGLNTLFIENSDLLLYLCGQFHPEECLESTFLSLVASAIRRNVIHCQTFLTPTAQSLLRSVFDAGIAKGTAEFQQLSVDLLNVASLVTQRLVRCPVASHDAMKCTRGLELFSRVSFEVFGRHEWIESFPTEAAENLILSCGFFCDGLPQSVAIDAESQQEERYAVLFSASNVPEQGLTIVETLLLFLGRSSSSKTNVGSEIEGQPCYDSYDRLAATVLASLVEKLPSRRTFEQTLLELLESRYHKSDKTFAKSFEEHCLLGMRNCIRLTRYDFQSDLNVLRLTYYSSIRAGVRTGIIAPQCSGVFERFDQEHLLRPESVYWHPSHIGESEQIRRSPSVRRHILNHSEDQLSISSSKHLAAEDATFDSELRELVSYSNEHAELLSVLTVSRKKAMTTAIRVATRNARVLVAFHAMTSIALDFYIDTAKKAHKQKVAKKRNNQNTERYQRRESAFATVDNTQYTVFLDWLLLLEQLAGLLCSGLNELDATYYMELAHQFRSLFLDLPAFLCKMERMGTHSRQQALMLFLDNLHRLLKRATNRNELRVVAANGSGIVDQTKALRERLRKLDIHISTSLAVLLDSYDGMENLSRMLTAMQYMWRRMMGATSIENAMASSRESVSLLKKIKEKFEKFFHTLRRPLTVLRTRHETSVVNKFDSPSDLLSAPSVTDSVNVDHSSQSASEHGGVGVSGRNSNNLSSHFPFTSLEMLLDHFGCESVAAKRTKQLLQASKTKNAAIGILKSIFGLEEEALERISVLELADRFQQVATTKKLSDVLVQLGHLALETQMPFEHLPFVVHDKVEMSLWRLMVRPIQRVRLFHLYQQTQRFVLSNLTRRRIMLEGYRQASPQRPVAVNRSGNNTLTKNHTKLVPESTRTSSYTRIFSVFLNKEQRVHADQTAHQESAQSVAAATGPWTTTASPKVGISQSTLKVCDGISSPDPFSDDAAMILLRRKLEAHKRRRHTTSIARLSSFKTESSRSAPYRYNNLQNDVLNRIRHGVVVIGARLVLLLAFWRHEELRLDLEDPIMARAFDDPHVRDDYYHLYHAKKGLGELVRVWMPTSGRLGLLLWQERQYALIGAFLSVAIALWLPALVFIDDGTEDTVSASKRNTIMTQIVYSYGIGIFLLSVVSIVLIAQNRFVLLEQTRLRLRPVSRYYQNVLALTAIGVELVQLNSLAFDSAVEWDSSDDLPAIVQWLGNQGITKFGVLSASELEALGVLLFLLSWFILLKCANKFQETSALLHRVLTKDLPALVHGFLYMSTISVFFSYLACADCSEEHGSSYDKCQKDPRSAPFLIAHQNIKCWTTAHRWYALLGFWGVTFFVPIGLLAHGMSQVLFQRETLDIKYAPVLILVVQLVKAAASTAQAFFPCDPIVLAILGTIGNAVLLVVALVMHSCSLWYIKYIKCSIYAASCWASLGAIHRLHYYTGQSSTRSLNIIYFGWLSIGLTTATAILLRVWLRVRAKQRDADRQFAAQERLLNTGGLFGAVEQKFMAAARKHSSDALTSTAFIENARRLDSSAPPASLNEFMARATEAPGSRKEAVHGVLFMQNARIMAERLREHQELRKRR